MAHLKAARHWRVGLALASVAVVTALVATPTRAQSELPSLTRPVNDFAGVIDAASAQQLDALIRSLQQASGDVVVVATAKTFAPYGDIREFANKLFENGGRGIGERGRDNGLLVVLAVDDRRVQVEVGYDLEAFITDGFAGEVSRDTMAPLFRRGEYGAGLLSGVSRIVERIAERRQVTLDGVRPVVQRRSIEVGSGGSLLVALFVLFLVLNAIAGRTRRRGRRDWGGAPWSGWNSGVGPFGGGRGGFGGFGGGGFGGGFGGFGGGRSGGGGGGAGW